MSYANELDKEMFAEMLENEEDMETFICGFNSALLYCYYKNLDENQKQMFNEELAERIVLAYSKPLFQEFAKEHGIIFE